MGCHQGAMHGEESIYPLVATVSYSKVAQY